MSDNVIGLPENLKWYQKLAESSSVFNQTNYEDTK